MTGKKDEDDKNWAGKGFSKRNEESAPSEDEDKDDESWAWK